jgi:hypothetical protein
MNVLPLLLPGLTDSAPMTPAEVTWPATDQSDLFDALLQASLGKSQALPDSWPIPAGPELWSSLQPTDADPAFLPDTNLPAPAAFALSSEAGSAIASLDATQAELWFAMQAAAVLRGPVPDEGTPPKSHVHLPVLAPELESGEVMRRIPIRIATDAAVRVAQQQSPVDLEFDLVLPRSLPFAIPAELDIPDRPIPVPEAAPVAEPERSRAPAVLPEVGKFKEDPGVKRAEREVEPPRVWAIEEPPKVAAPATREATAERAASAALRSVLHAPKVAAFASVSESRELEFAQVHERGRVRPLRFAPARPEAPPEVREAAVQAPKPVIFERQAAVGETAAQEPFESPSIHVATPKLDSQPGFTVTPNLDPGLGSLLETQFPGRAPNLEADVPVRFVLEDWTAGQPVRHVRVFLEPQELGGLRIFLRHSHQGIQARIVADRIEALPHVEAGLTALKGVLGARGIQFSSFSLTALTAATAAGAAGLRADGMPNGESAGGKQETRSQGRSKRSGRTTRS